MADRPRRWPAALGGLAVGAAGLAVVLGGIGLVESTIVGGQTRVWCEGTKGYDGTSGPLERCVRERNNRNLVAADQHLIEFYRADSGGDRYEPHPWPLDGAGVEVTFGDDEVAVTTAEGISASYPNSVYDDAR